MALDTALLKSILDANKLRGVAWKAGETSMLHLSELERSYRMGCMPEPGESWKEREALSASRVREEALGAPATFDWRNVNARSFISSVKDQGSCGSCVAFGTTAAMDGMMRIQADIAVGDPNAGRMPDVSEAELWYCGAEGQGRTCQGPAQGWWVSAALAYCQTTGLAPESCFPYTPGDQACTMQGNWQQLLTKISSASTLTSPGAMKAWLSSSGPLITAFTVYQDFFAYQGGVYTWNGVAPLAGAHCVCVIGYDDGQQAWICKNSWGQGWGMGGYFLIGYGQCGIDASMTAIVGFSQILGQAIYNDIYVRDNFNDSGVTPSTGVPYQSPDIIPYQNNSLAWSTANGAYLGPDLGMDIVNGGANNIYVRAKNLNTSAGSGTVSLYYADASLFLAPSTWVPVTVPGGGASATYVGGDGTSVIQPDAVALSNPAFLLSNLPPGPHYCLIAVVQTAAHPTQIPTSFATLGDYVAWVQGTPAVGWRNISYAPSGSAQIIRSYGFANINPTPDYFHVMVQGQGFPVGTPINVQCTDQTCMFNQNLTLPAPDQNGNQITGFDVYVPAAFSGSMVVTAASLSGPFPVGANLAISYYQYPSTSRATDLAVSRTCRISKGSGTQGAPLAASLIKVGECTIVVGGGS